MEKLTERQKKEKRNAKKGVEFKYRNSLLGPKKFQEILLRKARAYSTKRH